MWWIPFETFRYFLKPCPVNDNCCIYLACSVSFSFSLCFKWECHLNLAVPVTLMVENESGLSQNAQISTSRNFFKAVSVLIICMKLWLWKYLDVLCYPQNARTNIFLVLKSPGITFWTCLLPLLNTAKYSSFIMLISMIVPIFFCLICRLSHLDHKG